VNVAFVNPTFLFVISISTMHCSTLSPFKTSLTARSAWPPNDVSSRLCQRRMNTTANVFALSMATAVGIATERQSTLAVRIAKVAALSPRHRISSMVAGRIIKRRSCLRPGRSSPSASDQCRQLEAKVSRKATQLAESLSPSWKMTLLLDRRAIRDGERNQQLRRALNERA
jgi:hypothetical protein